MDLIRENYDISPTSDDDDQTSEPDGAVHRPSEELVLSCIRLEALICQISCPAKLSLSSSSIVAIFL
jgi:hypothetical protein